MPVLKPPVLTLPMPKDGDPRVFELIATSPEPDPSVIVVGFPCDLGVNRNAGRLGSAEAPDAIRKFFYRLAPDATQSARFRELLAACQDLGNVDAGIDLEQSQQDLASVIAPHLERQTPLVILGGGHETSFGHFLGYAQAQQMISIINFDAHLDVRDLIDGKGHSGSPFRQALEHESKLCQKYSVAGVLSHSVSGSHLDYVRKKGGRIYENQELTSSSVPQLFSELHSPTMVSFDLDVVDQAFAPGVSSPATGGLTAHLLLQAAYEAGKCPWVRSIDIVEMNPRFDRDGQTARLGALLLWNFLSGICRRS